MPIEMTDNRRAKELHDTLTVSVKAIDDTLKSRIEDAKAEALAAIEPLKDAADDYWLELMAGATEQFQVKELNDAKVRTDMAFAKVGTMEDSDLSAVSQVNGEIANALYWVVAKPVDEKKIAQVKKDDLAAEAAAKLEVERELIGE